MTKNEGIQFLLREAAECCAALRLKHDLIVSIYQSDSDWAFILKIDALIETSVKEVIKRSLKLKINDAFIGDAELEKFISNLPMNGRTSLLKLLRATNCDRDICDFIEAARNVRNAFAHNINNVETSLLTVIQNRQEWRDLLKRLSPIENYDEAEWVKMIQTEAGILRYSILHYTLVFLTLAYHVVLKEPVAPLDLRKLAE
jgi:uncharacterized protein YutE (UPF0331/DUF86 family)